MNGPLDNLYIGPPNLSYVHTEALIIHQLFKTYGEKITPLTGVTISSLYDEALYENELYH